jgi:hypothetical protein
MEEKDALQSSTNIALATLLSTYLATQGIALDAQTIIAIGATLIGFFGRWRAGGIVKVAGIKIPQPGGHP